MVIFILFERRKHATLTTCNFPITLTAPPGYQGYSWANTSAGGTVGIVGIDTNQTVVINQAGNYQVTMTTPAGPTCVVLADFIVVSNPPPTAAFTNTTVCVGTTTQFTDGSTPVGSITSWSWDFDGDGLTDNSTQSPSNTYAAAGTYPVTLIVSNGLGCSDTITQNVIVNPIATIDGGPDQTICVGSTVTLAGLYTGAATIGTWSNGTGTYNPNNTTGNAVYTPSAAEETAGTVMLIYTTDAPAGPCVDNIDTMMITINQIATANAGPPQTICVGSSATLAGSIGGSATSATWGGGTGTYNPNNNSVTAVYTPSAAEITAGLVTLTLITNDPAGPCPAATSTVVITINPIATVNAGPDQTICIGNPVTLAGVFGGASTSGTWSGGTGTYNPSNTTANAAYTPSAAEGASGSVILTFSSDDPAGPCPAVTDQMTIFIDQLATANAGAPQSICVGNNITLAGVIGGAATSGTWTGGAGTFTPNNTTLNAVYTPSAAEFLAGTVTLTLTTTNGTSLCPPVSSTVTHNLYENPLPNFIVDVPKGCPIHCVNFTDQSTVGGPNSIASWNWNFGDPNSGTINNSSALQNPSHCYAGTGFYTVTLTVTTNNGCSATLTIPQMIQVFAIPIAEFDPTPNPVSSLNPLVFISNQSSSDVVYWNWNFGDGNVHPNYTTTDPSHLYPNTIDASYMITLIVHNADGCKDTVQHPITVGPEFTFFIPNAFTPNYDGVNDDFNGYGVGIVEYDIWIFDRWGNMIFHTDKPHPLDGWDGKANYGNEEAQIDVYVWKVKLTDIFGRKHKYIGTVTLVK